MMVFLLFFFIFFILQSIAFFTLMERHVLGLTQNRLGPKKVGYMGVLQPIVDGLKLMKKEFIVPYNVSLFMFLGIVFLSFVLMFMEYMSLYFFGSILTMNWSYFYVVILVSMKVYNLMLGGIFSKSKYAMLGGIRSAVASVGYEIMFFLSILLFMLYTKNCILSPLCNLGLIFMFLCFMMSALVELGRTPFDYSESESELVSGYNTEYSSVGFTLLFLSEYGSIVFFSELISIVFFWGSKFFTCLVFFLMILIRSSLPRLRYDKMIGLMWLSIFFFVGVSFYCTYFLLMV